MKKKSKTSKDPNNGPNAVVPKRRRQNESMQPTQKKKKKPEASKPTASASKAVKGSKRNGHPPNRISTKPKSMKKKSMAGTGFSRRGRETNLQHHGIFIPGINVCLVYPQRSKKSPCPGIPRVDRAVNRNWALVKYEYDYLRKKAGSHRGGRKHLRQDHTWQDYGTSPPLILTHTARQTLKEYGPGALPRFARSTNKTVVMTFKPNFNPKASQRRRKNLAVFRSFVEENRRKLVKQTEKTRKKKRKAALKRNKLLIKPKLIKRSNRMMCADFIKSGAAYSAGGKGKGGLKKAVLVHYPCLRPLETGQNTIRKKKRLPKKTMPSNEKSTEGGKEGKTMYACLGENCSYTSTIWDPTMCQHLRSCRKYGVYSAKGKMKQCQEKARLSGFGTKASAHASTSYEQISRSETQSRSRRKGGRKSPATKRKETSTSTSTKHTEDKTSLHLADTNLFSLTPLTPVRKKSMVSSSKKQLLRSKVYNQK